MDQINQNQIHGARFATVTAAEAAGRRGEVCYVDETGKTYAYYESSAEVVDHINVLDTVNGGTTRWVAVAGVAVSEWTNIVDFTATPLEAEVSTISFAFTNASATVEASADCIAQGVRVGQFIYNHADDTRAAAKQIIAIAANKTTITLKSTYGGTTNGTAVGYVFGEYLTMTEDLTASIKAGRPARYVIDAVTYYGVVDEITSDHLKIIGPAFSGDVTDLAIGPISKVAQLQFVIPNSYEDASEANLIVADLKSAMVWDKSTAYLVGFKVYTDTKDTSSDGQASVEIGNDECFLQAGGPILAAAKTWYPTGIGIDPSAYNLEYGEEVEITCIKGTGGDAQNLSVKMIFVTP